MSTLNATATTAHTPQPRRTLRQVLLSYFYWTYSRGSFHYDVMVTLILAFIFITPWVWDYGDKPSATAGLEHPMQVVSDGGHGLIVTVHAADVAIPAGASNSVVKQALRKAIEPVMGDAVFVERWGTATDPTGQTTWKVWAHR